MATGVKEEKIRQMFAETAKSIVHEEGIAALTIRNIAAKSGYTFPSIYNHFASIDELLWITRGMLFTELGEYVTGRSPQEPKSSIDIKKVFHAYLEYFILHPNVYRFLYFRELDKDKMQGTALYESEEFARQNMKTFEFLIKEKNRTPEEVALIMRTLIFSAHGALTLLTTGNDSLKPETAYDDMDRIIDFLI